MSGERVKIGTHLTFPRGDGTLPCDRSDDAFDVTYPPPRQQTDACENISFPQLLLRVVIR